MKKFIFASIIISILTMITAFADMSGCTGNELKLQIGNPIMNACGVMKEIDEGRGTVPVIDNGFTLVPIRSIIESFGGRVYWDDEEKQVSVDLNGKGSVMTVNSKTVEIYTSDGIETAELDVVPRIINGRTMVPIRFVSESLGMKVGWDNSEKIVTITEPKYPSVKFENVDGEFEPMGNLFDFRMGNHETVEYVYKGKTYTITADITSIENLPYDMNYQYDNKLNSITINGKKYGISDVYNFLYLAIGDIGKDTDGFQLMLADAGVSEDYTVEVFTYNDTNGLVSTHTYGGMVFPYYTNGVGTIYCNSDTGRIINNYIGFTDPIYAYEVNKITGGSGIVADPEELTSLEPDVIGKELKFGIDLFAVVSKVSGYPKTDEEIWELEPNFITIKKGTPIIIDEIKYFKDDDFGTKWAYAYFARVNGEKCVIQLGYAG